MQMQTWSLKHPFQPWLLLVLLLEMMVRMHGPLGHLLPLVSGMLLLLLLLLGAISRHKAARVSKQQQQQAGVAALWHLQGS